MASAGGVRAWEAAVQVAIGVRALVSHFPARGYTELRDQMIRSAESISSNIAEGRGSDFPLEFVRSLDIAARSSNELSSRIALAVAYQIVPERDAFNLKGTVICTQRMIESLRDHIRERRATRPSKPEDPS